ERTFTAEAEPPLGPVVAAASLEKPKPSQCRSLVASLRAPLYAGELKPPMVSPPPRSSANPTDPGKPVLIRKKPSARSIVTVTVLPTRARFTVPKLPDEPKPELELP